MTIRRWKVSDSEALASAIEDSLDELRAWLPWVANEPLSIAARRKQLAEWEHEWKAGGSVLLGAFRRGRVVGASGMHRRIGPGGLEFGYWVRTGETGRGLATQIARAVAGTALGVPRIDHVEIHHDQANSASARIPEKLGFTLVERRSREPVAVKETGVEWIWRMHRSEIERLR